MPLTFPASVVVGPLGCYLVRHGLLPPADKVSILSEQGFRLVSVPFRYAWPAELDLMATMAALRLKERWGSWRGEPFTAASDQHVSVYELGG